MFSKACEYGIKAMISIAGHKERDARVRLKDIAKEIDSPEAFTAKILQTLTKDGLLKSTKGPAGGFSLAMPAQDIKVSMIILALDGDSIFTSCVLGLSECNPDKPCPIHHKVVGVRQQLKEVFHETSLSELSMEFLKGDAFLAS